MKIEKITASALSLAIGLSSVPAVMNANAEKIEILNIAETLESDKVTAIEELIVKADDFSIGDVNNDGIVDASDASEILKEYAAAATGNPSVLSEAQKKAADVDNNGIIDSSDASCLLAYYAYAATDPNALSAEEIYKKYNGLFVPTNTTPVTTASTTATVTTTATTTVTSQNPADPTMVTKIVLSKTKMTLNIGHQDVALLSYEPSTAIETGITWTSSNEKVATVNNNGWVMGVSAGTCIITAQSHRNPNVTATVEVTVIDPNAPATTTATTATSSATTTTSAAATSASTTNASTTVSTASATNTSTVTSSATAASSSQTTTSVTASSESSTASTTADPKVVSEIKLSKEELNINVGYLDVSYISVLPVTATEMKGFTWTSSDESIATVDDQGWVTAKSAGTCYVTVTSMSNPSVSAKIKVNVTDPYKVSKITLTDYELTIPVNGTGISYVKMEPETAADFSEIWSSSDNSVATVDGNGLIKGIKAGSCTVTVTSKNNPNVSAEIKVTIVDNSTDTTTSASTTSSSTETTATDSATTSVSSSVSETTSTSASTVGVTSIGITKSVMNLAVGENDYTQVTLFPVNASNKNIIWKSSDEKVAVVDNGKVTAVGEGSCEITVQSADNPVIATTVKVTVSKAVATTVTSTSTTATTTVSTSTQPAETNKITKIDLSKTSMTLNVNEQDISFVTMSPASVADKGEIWTSSDTSVATVNEWGWVTAKKAGSCTITVTSTNNPDVKAYINVTVIDNSVNKIQNISLSKTSMTLNVNEQDISYVTMSPASVADKGEIWTSSDTSVATVNEWGWVTAKKAGSCTITVTSTNNPNVKAYVYVTVIDNSVNKIQNISLTKTSMTLNVDAVDISYVTMTPASVADKGEIWTSSDTSVATVDECGWVTAKGVGSCVITVTSTNNPNVKAYINVTVTGNGVSANTVNKIVLTDYELTIPVEKLGISYVTMLPETAINKGEIWSVSDDSIASVDQDGWIYGRRQGICYVTVRSQDNPSVYAVIKVTII